MAAILNFNSGDGRLIGGLEPRNRPFPSSLVPLFQNESMFLRVNENEFCAAVSFSCKSKSFS